MRHSNSVLLPLFSLPIAISDGARRFSLSTRHKRWILSSSSKIVDCTDWRPRPFALGGRAARTSAARADASSRDQHPPMGSPVTGDTMLAPCTRIHSTDGAALVDAAVLRFHRIVQNGQRQRAKGAAVRAHAVSAWMQSSHEGSMSALLSTSRSFPSNSTWIATRSVCRLKVLA
jgi:hypothetical protein